MGTVSKKKFQTTDTEVSRPPLELLPEPRKEEDALKRSEFDDALNKLRNNKKTGPDGIPIEVYKKCT